MLSTVVNVAYHGILMVCIHSVCISKISKICHFRWACIQTLLVCPVGGRLLLEINRVLRPGGYFITSTKHGDIDAEEGAIY